MANFYPFKVYILLMLDELIQKHSIHGPFLDVGCGRGDVALHFAEQGWHGEAIDISDQAVEAASMLLKPYPHVKVHQKEVNKYRGRFFGLVMFLDVIEHLPDDKAVIRSSAKIQKPGDYLVLTIPSNPEREWRWDDEVYGHLRRYNPYDIEKLLITCGYKVIEHWDISYPVFWILRRVFTAIKNAPQLNNDFRERTQQSPFTNAWDFGWLSDFLSNPTLWRPIFLFQRKFRYRTDRGNELMVLAKREPL